MAILTDWRPIYTDATTTDPDTGETVYYWSWVQYNDDEIAIDLADSLASGETVTNVSTHLWLLHSTSETSDTNVDTLMPTSATVSGTVVRQRISGLVKDRYYRLFVEFGAVGNHRTISAVIRVVG